MRILAIRGENLASLDGSFTVDFTAEPLGRSGLFAITGPTGAGKSTLLDAICLCLYDSTPRMASSGGAVVRLEGAEDATALKATDQRNVLRRGTGHGWAEVDFTGRDGRSYTARWEVRRARKSPTGRIQNQDWSLRLRRAPTDQVLVAGKKAEVAQAIRQQVGLDFDQFRRSVLLAQGDFAAFLKASEHERALLLEQMTGSEIYTRLSRAAYDQSRALHKQRATLEVQLGEHQTLTDDQRAAADAALVAAGKARQEAAVAEKKAERAVAWHTAQAALDAQLDQAEKARSSAAQAVAASADRRARLERMEAAWPLRAVAAEVRRAAQAEGVSEQALVAARKLRVAAEGRHTANRAAEAQAKAGVHAAWTGLNVHLNARLTRARAGRDALQAWLSDRPGVVHLTASDNLVRLVGEADRPGSLDKRVELVARVRGLVDKERPQLVAATDKARAEVGRAQARRTTAEQQLQQAGTTRAAAEAEQKAAEATVPEALGRTLRARRQAHTALVGVAGRAADALAARDAAQVDLGRQTTRHTEALKQAGATDAAMKVVAKSLERAEHSLQDARAAVDAAGLRAKLVPGKACAVCGSTHHPWADGSPLADVFASLETTVTTLRSEQADHTRVLAEARAEARSATRARTRAEGQVAEATKKLGRLAAEWADKAGALSEPVRHVGPDSAASVADRQLALDRADAELRSAEAAWEANQARLRAARVALSSAQAAERTALKSRDAAVSTVEKAVAKVPSLEQACTRLDGEVEKLAERVQSIEGEVERALGAILPELSGWEAMAVVARWREHLDAPGAVVDALRGMGRTVAHKQRRLKEAEDVIQALERGSLVAAPRAETAEQPADGVPTVVFQPPDGLPAHHTTWWQRTARGADAALDTARAALKTSEHALQQAVQKEGAAAATHATRHEAHAGQRARLAEQLAALDGDAQLLQQVCALPGAWAETERPALAALDRALEAAVVRVDERRVAWQAHAAHKPEADARVAGEQLAASQAHRAKADETWSSCRVVIEHDDRARTVAARLTRALTDHDTRAEPWLQLSRCIGSASGKEFRKYAQSLTLELLLEQANDHLRRLHPRYRLARIAGTDLDILVIDGDLGDEARTVRGLSGGEGFLVSLALALGLSSLSARDVRVESLFIDEGFGTLDAASLDKALAVLDSLQSEGRQVGIISHVGGLAERIGVQVRVEPQGGGRSRVRVVG